MSPADQAILDQLRGCRLKIAASAPCLIATKVLVDIEDVSSLVATVAVVGLALCAGSFVLGWHAPAWWHALQGWRDQLRMRRAWLRQQRRARL